MIALGCAKNLVDAEIMLGALIRDGMEITNEPSTADVLIVNTCSFIDAAQQESVDAILESAELREAHRRGQGLVVSGCLSQRFREELPKLLPEVDAFMGIDQVSQVSAIVREAIRVRQEKLRRPHARTNRLKVVSKLAQPGRESGEPAAKLAPADGAATNGSPGSIGGPLVQITPRPKYIPDYATPRFRLTPRHLAYVKIAEGCNHPCSFCIIPRMRGSHRSRSQDDIVREARQLIAGGVRELNLISQDSTYYGMDLRPSRKGSLASPERFRTAAQSLPSDTPTLGSLLRALNEIQGDFWVRLLYTHPAHWTDELMRTIAECSKVVRYVDIPLQHIHPIMLERMRRETSEQYIRDLLARLRQTIPGIALRTTFIVGFPGETEACFEALLSFIREARFERAGVFLYSHEEGTRAAEMKDQVPAATKARRRDQAMAEQLQVSRGLGAASVGRILRVLVEKKADTRDFPSPNLTSWEHGEKRQSAPAAALPRHCSVARGEADAPDIDGRVLVRGVLQAGTFATVRVVGHTDYDLIAEPLDVSPETNLERSGMGCGKGS